MSKRVSFGLPISKYVALTHHKPLPSSLDTHTQDSGKSNNGQQSQGEHTLPSSKSYFRFTIEHDSSSGTEVPTIQTVRSVIKSILRSQEELVIIPPTFHDLAPIWSNRELPEKKNTRLMHQYIHQGRMLPASFSGKLLIGHPTQTDILPTISKALESYPEVKIYHAKFGISKVINIGVLCGTFQQERRQALSHRLESLLCALAGGHHTPIAAVWDTVYGDGNPHTSTGAIFIKCKIEDTTSVCAGLLSLYGSVAETRDTLRPMVRFVSLATLKSTDLVTSQVIARQFRFLSSIHTCTLQNIGPLMTQIKIPNTSSHTTVAKLLTSIKDFNNSTPIHAVVLSGHQNTKRLWHPLSLSWVS